jgi:SAM-dependent methyltransferase
LPSFEAYGGSAPENYERYSVPAIGAPLAVDLVEVAALGDGDRVLDVASGTGIVPRLAAARVGPGGTVSGLDINSGMLAVARSATPQGLAIDWHDASAEAMPLATNAVLCQMALQFFPDKVAALREMRRVLSPGGRLVVNLPDRGLCGSALQLGTCLAIVCAQAGVGDRSRLRPAGLGRQWPPMLCWTGCFTPSAIAAEG